MNKERFFAANIFALITHGVVSKEHLMLKHYFRRNLLISAKSEPKHSKRERLSMALDGSEDGCSKRYWKTFIEQEVVYQSSGLRKDSLITF